MDHAEIIKFAIDNVEWIDKVQNSLFREIRLKCFASGVNAHTLPVDKEVLKRGAQTVYDKPIVWKYSVKNDDAMSHEEDEIPAGFVKESTTNSKTFGGAYSNPIDFEEDPDGRLFMYVNALIWTRYCGRLIDIFERDDGYKSVSIEMAIMPNKALGRPRVDEYVIAGITILGENVRPACKGAQATLINFAEDKESYLTQYMAHDVNAIEIDNANIVLEQKWTNPRNTLYTALSKTSNSKELFEEAYLQYDMSASKYVQPHHIVKDNKLVLHADGLKSVLEFAVSHNIYEGAVQEHIIRHYKEAQVNNDNYATLGLSEEMYNDLVAPYICNEAGETTVMSYTFNQIRTLLDQALKETDTMKEFWIQDLDMTHFYVRDYESGATFKCAYTLTEEGGVVMDLENKTEVMDGFVELSEEEMGCKNEEMAAEEEVENVNEAEKEGEEKEETPYMAEDENKDEEAVETKDVDNSEDAEDDEEEDDEEDKEDDKEDSEEEMAEEPAAEEDMSIKMSELLQENEELKARLVDMSDYEELKQFKIDTEKRIQEEAELNQMNVVMSEIEAKGVEISEDEKAEFIAEFAKFSSIDAWSNHVKASVFDRAENIDGIVRIGTPYNNTPKTSNSVWDE